ncbi:MAG: LytTR family DNA-binding domain-containing protein [Bacteroidales bacterium]|nr:LytTR family DNA-binding domain-containing protein [Bacteroidales bacterium]
MLRAVIVEDEKRSRETLSGLLKIYCKNLTVVGEAENVREGLEVIKQQNPDVVFLDIQMPDGSGFKLLEQIKQINFDVIFTTAYDQFAIKAIRFSALDYLLKPIFPNDLVNAVNKAEKNKQAQKSSSNIKVLLENINRPPAESPKIILSTSEKINVVKVEEIIRCESDNYYTMFYFTDEKRLLVSKTLKEQEELLSEYNFIRPHKSHLINVKYIKSYLKTDGGVILMEDGSKIPVSRRKKEYIKEILSNL